MGRGLGALARTGECVMAEFTPLSSWQHLQDTDAANEIVQAYNERRQCVDADFEPVSLLGAGSNAQDTLFWRRIQQWVTSQMVLTGSNRRWINHAQDVDESADPFFTLVDFKYASGLVGGADSGGGATVGWRRATTKPADWTDYEDAAYGYGVIQAGDIRGPWFFEDLQKALDSMRWSVMVNPSRTEWQSRVGTGTGEDANEAISEASDDYTTSGWLDPGGFKEYYHNEFDVSEIGGGQFICNLVRHRSKLEFKNIPTHIRADVKFFCILDTFLVGDLWNDADFPELANVPGWREFDDLGEKQTAQIDIGYNEFDTPPIANTYTVGNFYTVTEFNAEQGCFLVMKWQFSHTLPEPE
jgi:hypothetical protein